MRSGPMTATRRSGLALLFALAAPTWTAAQSPDSAGAGPLFDGRDAWIATAYLATGVAVLPFDRAIAAEVQDTLFQDVPALRTGSSILRLLGFPGSAIIGGGLYGAGRVFGDDDLADVGLHVTEAILVAEALTYTVKLLAGRGRPSLDPDDPFDFRFGRGFQGDDWQSLPSGHTSAAFATAAASAHELARLWPGHDLLVGVLTYGPASLVGVSRIFHNRHWASDVVFGAAIGAFSGWKIVDYNHDNPDNAVNRIFLTVSAPPGQLSDFRLGLTVGR